MDQKTLKGASKLTTKPRTAKMPLCLAEACEKALKEREGKTGVEFNKDLTDLALMEDLKAWLTERGIPVRVMPATERDMAVMVGRTMCLIQHGISSVVNTLAGMGMVVQLLEERTADLKKKEEAKRKLAEHKAAKLKGAEAKAAKPETKKKRTAKPKKKETKK